MNKEIFNDYLKYKDGKIFWKKHSVRPSLVGKRAGSLDGKGYRQVHVAGKIYKEHRVIWMMHNYNIPSSVFIDHINIIKTDNRIENLRIADTFQSAANKLKRRGKCKYKGVIKNKYGRFESSIRFKNKRYSVGTFKTEIEAASAYNKRAKEIHGEFASLNIIEPSSWQEKKK